MHDGAILVAHEEPGAGGEGRKLVHEVVEEDFLEGVPAQLGQRVHLGHEIFVFELSAGVDLDSVVEGLGHGQQVDEFHEAGERVHEVADDGRPAHCRGVVERNFVDQGNVGLDGVEMRHHGGVAGQNEQG